MNKQREQCKIITIAVPCDTQIGEKERKRDEKYQDLKEEICCLWRAGVNVTRVVDGDLGFMAKLLAKESPAKTDYNTNLVVTGSSIAQNRRDFVNIS